MATLPEVKHNVRTRTADYIDAYFNEHERYPVDIGLIHGDFIADELYAGFDWSDDVEGFHDFSSGTPGSPLMFERWISTVESGSFQKDYVYEWDGIQWAEIEKRIGKPYWIKSQEVHKYFDGDEWVQLAGSGGTTDHRDLENLNSTNYWHLTQSEYQALLLLPHIIDGKEDTGVAAGLVAAHENYWDHDSFLTELPDHNHNHDSLSELDVGNYRHLSATHKTDLTDGGDSSLHYHSADRNRANHSGTQAISTVSGLQDALDGKQSLNSNLTAISALSVTSDNFIIGNGSTFVSRKLQNSDLPAIAITDTFVVASQAAMLALSAAERGDVAVRTDLNKSFILKGDNPASLSDWQELLTPTDAVLSVDGRTGVVSLSDKYQPLDADLTAIAGLTHSNRHVLISNGTNWTRRALEEADLPSLSASKLPATVVYTDNAQTITGVKTFNPNTNFGNTITFTGTNKWITSNTATTDKNSVIILGYPNAANSGYIAAHEINHATRPGDVVLQAGGTGKILLNSQAECSGNVTIAGSIIGSRASGLSVQNNTIDGSDTKTLLLCGGGSYQSTRGATIALRGNESTAGYGNLELNAGDGNGTITGAVRISPRAYFGTRPANDYLWTLALDQYNTLYGTVNGTNIMHNLYYDGANWRYRYGSGSNSGGVVTTLAYNQFSVNVADNGTVDQVATLTPAIRTNLSGNTAFGKNTFVGGYKLEVEGNTLVNGNIQTTGNIDVGGTVDIRGGIRFRNRDNSAWEYIARWNPYNPLKNMELNWIEDINAPANVQLNLNAPAGGIWSNGNHTFSNFVVGTPNSKWTTPLDPLDHVIGSLIVLGEYTPDSFDIPKTRATGRPVPDGAICLFINKSGHDVEADSKYPIPNNQSRTFVFVENSWYSDDYLSPIGDDLILPGTTPTINLRGTQWVAILFGDPTQGHAISRNSTSGNFVFSRLYNNVTYDLMGFSGNGVYFFQPIYLDPSKVKAGTSQAGAGAVAGELWRNTSTGALHLGI